MSPILIYYHMEHSSLIPLLIHNLPLQPGGNLAPTIYLNAQPKYTCLMVSELLTQTLMKPNYQLELKAYVQFFLPLAFQTSLFSKVT